MTKRAKALRQSTASVPDSAGVLIFRRNGHGTQLLLVHPGGPYWRNKSIGSWQIPKGLIDVDEPTIVAARREAEEELGLSLTGEMVPLAQIRQAGGKWIDVFTLEMDLDADHVRGNDFQLEWPPRSGRYRAFPEIDAARWFDLTAAEIAILPSQRPLITALRDRMGAI